jgi:thiol-disulfide isomerase/thioredoxin
MHSLCQRTKNDGQQCQRRAGHKSRYCWQHQGYKHQGCKQQGGGVKSIQLIVFFAPWCGHCHIFMDGKESVWEQLKRGHHEEVTFVQVNCDENRELVQKFNIRGFPTILKIKNTKVIPFEGERTVKALEEFMSK